MTLIKSEKKENSQYSLEFSIDKAAFDAAVSNAYRKNVKRINVPGFRRGKAPRNVIERMYGKGFFYEDALNDLIPAVYPEVVKEADIHPVAQPEIDIKSIDENGVVLTANVFVKPEVTLKKYVGLEASKKVEEVTDAEIDSEINMTRQRNGREIDVTDEPAAKDDTAKIDFEGFVDGVAFDGGNGENYSLKLGSGQFIPGFEDQIIGKKVGDEFDVNVTFPADYNAENLAGKPAVFKVKVNALTRTELPALDDEFAKDVSEFDTFAAYRADVAEKIKTRHQNNADNAFEGKVMEALIGEMEADVPAPMFDNEVDNMVKDYDNRMQMQGLNLDMYFKYTGLTMDQLRAQMRPQAEKQVKGRLALEKVAELEKLVPTDDDLAAEYDRIAKEYGMEVEKVKEYLPAETIAEDLKVKKALDLIKEKAVIVDEPAEKKAAKTTKAKTAKKADAEATEEGKAAPKAAAKKSAAKTAEKAEGEKEPAEKKPAAKTTKAKTTKKEDKQD